jgi:Tfp pilus assembly protein PilE
MKVGFTFLEVLIALLVTVILVSVTCSSLLTSLKAEQISDWQRDASFLVNQLATEAWLGMESTGVTARTGGEWEIHCDDIEAGSGSDAIAWRTWVMYPRERPSLTVTFSSRL